MNDEERQVDVQEDDLTRLPPKMVRRHVEDLERGLITIEDGRVSGAPAIVEALQQYVDDERLRSLQRIEHERFQATNRMKGVVGMFVGLLILFCAVAYLLISLMLGRQQERIMVAEEAAKSAHDKVAAIEIAQSGQGTDRRLLVEMRKDIEDIRVNNDREVKALVNALGELEVENATLVREMNINGAVPARRTGSIGEVEAVRVAAIRIPGLQAEENVEEYKLETELDLRPRILKEEPELDLRPRILKEEGGVAKPASRTQNLRLPGLSPE